MALRAIVGVSLRVLHMLALECSALILSWNSTFESHTESTSRVKRVDLMRYQLQVALASQAQPSDLRLDLRSESYDVELDSSVLSYLR